MSRAESPVDCHAAIEHLYELFDGELTATLEQEVRAHLHNCAECFPLFEFERTFHRFVAAHANAVEAPPALRRRIFEQIFEPDSDHHAS